ncbi:MAG: DUF58 domain-containing protein [Vicinamibacterales bacterium]
MIPANVLRELRYLEVYTARKIRNLRVGPYTSPLRGTGFDFDEHRPYRPGDDVRRIDWNVTARLNAPFLRQTHAERELTITIALDLSPSMTLGSLKYSKKEVMTFITASLLFSAASDQINVGFLAFSDRVLQWVPPRRASGRAWEILEKLWAIEPTGTRTALRPAIEHLVGRLKAMSIVCLVSDFITDEDVFGSGEMRALAARHDVIAIIPEDPAEVALPRGHGTIRLRDPESGRAIPVALNAQTRQAYSEAVAQRRTALIDGCYRASIDHVFVRTDGPVMEPLLGLFARRRLG